MTDSPLPTPHQVFFEIGLYEPITLDVSGNKGWLHSVIYVFEPIDAFCIQCELTTPFRNQVDASRYGIDVSPRVFAVNLKCARCHQEYLFFFALRSDSLTRIGQVPSFADIAQGDLVRFRGVLDAADRKALNKAVGLFAHGIGAGSFVYLRRVFEGLVAKARSQAIIEARLETPSDDEYLNMRMDKRIKSLRSYLPDLLVNNARLYAVLSQGVHELSEEQCNAYFRIVYEGILTILESDLRDREILERQERTNAALQRLLQKTSLPTEQEPQA